jgi:hypothetical protein
MVGSTSYTPTAATAFGSGYSTPITGTSPIPISLNNKTYQLTLTLATADPGVGSTKADFMQVTVVVCPVIGGVVNASSPQRLVTYVAQP